MIHFNFFTFLKKQLASTMWPSDSFMPKVSAKNGHKNSTEAEHVTHQVNSVIKVGHDSDGSKDKLMTQYMEYISKNLLEVIEK